MTRVSVVVVPIGPPCCVQTDDGLLIRGYRVEDDYIPAQSEHVFVGRPVRFRTVNPKGDVVFDADGRQQTHKSANGRSLTLLEDGARIEVRPVEPPPLLPRARRATP